MHIVKRGIIIICEHQHGIQWLSTEAHDLLSSQYNIYYSKEVKGQKYLCI